MTRRIAASRQDQARVRREAAEQQRLENYREAERQRLDEQRRNEREDIRGNNRDLRDIPGRRVKVYKSKMHKGVADLDVEISYEDDEDTTPKRFKFHGPTRDYILIKSNGEKVWRFECSTQGYSLEEARLQYDPTENELTMFEGYVTMALKVEEVIVNVNGIASVEQAPDGTFTFSIPILEVEEFNDYKIHYEKSGHVTETPVDFKSWNDVD